LVKHVGPLSTDFFIDIENAFFYQDHDEWGGSLFGDETNEGVAMKRVTIGSQGSLLACLAMMVKASGGWLENQDPTPFSVDRLLKEKEAYKTGSTIVDGADY